MLRCATCGRRYADGAPVCEHEAQPGPRDIHHALPVAPSELRERFCIRGLLGRGGFGHVFAGTAVGGTDVAVKVVSAKDPLTLRRFLDEIEALRSIGPPHVPEVVDSGVLSNGDAFLAMERIDAPTLADLLTSAPLDMPTFVPVALAVLDALAHTHRRGFVHRDLKPENIFIVGSPPCARLVDFGLARRGGSDDEARTAPGELVGTTEYMSPEQCAGHRDIDVRTDIYSVGVVFYEMLAGRPPFFGSPAEVRHAHCARRPARLSTIAKVGSALEDVVHRCIEKDRGRRFESVETLRAAIQAAIEEARPRSIGDTPGPPSVPRQQRLRETVALVSFESSELDLKALEGALAELGGELVYASGVRHTAAFARESADNPARGALAAARVLVERAVCRNVLLDLGVVSYRFRPDGSRQFQSALFGQSSRYPEVSDPAGVLMTSAALEVIDDVAVEEVANRKGWLLNVSRPAEGQGTNVRFDLPLIGRDETVRAILDSALLSMATRTCTIVTVIAEAGHGKSRLAAALLDDLRKLPRVDVLDLRGKVSPEADTGTPRDLLAKLLTLPDAPPSDGGTSLLAKQLGDDIAKESSVALALSLGWMAPDDPAIQSFAAAPGVLRDAAARGLGWALRARARRGPLLVVLDDGHLIDATTLDAIEYAALSTCRAPLWVCVLARPSFESGRPSWGERAGKHQTFRLGPLAAPQAQQLCRELLRPAEHVPQEAIDYLIARSGGIPLLLVELTRSLKRDGLVRQDPKTNAWYVMTDALDRSADSPLIGWLAAREIETLPADLASHLRLAALVGQEFSVDDVRGVLDKMQTEQLDAEFPLDAEVGLKRLQSLDVLVAHRGGTLAFRHALLRDAVYESIPQPLRARLHHAAYLHYRDLHRGAEAMLRLALHAAASGLQADAASLYLELANTAKARHQYLEAERFFSHTIALTPEAPTRFRALALQGRALMRYRLSRFRDALLDFQLAREIAVALGDSSMEVDLLLDEATALDWSDEFRRSRELVERAQQLAPGLHSPLIDARILVGLGRSAYRFSREAEAVDLLTRAAAQAEPLGDAAYETYVIALLLLGGLLAMLGRLDESESVFERLIPLCEQRGDRLHLGAAYSNRPVLWIGRNDKTRLLADLTRLLEISRELGVLRLEREGELYLALYYHWLGDYESANEHGTRVWEIDEQRLGTTARPESALLCARICVFRGDAERARELVERVRAQCEGAAAFANRELELVPGEEVFFRALDLAVQQRVVGWDDVMAKARRFLTAADRIEIIELRGLTSLRAGRPDLALDAFGEALNEALRAPNLAIDRIRREIEQALSAQP